MHVFLRHRISITYHFKWFWLRSRLGLKPKSVRGIPSWNDLLATLLQQSNPSWLCNITLIYLFNEKIVPKVTVPPSRLFFVYDEKWTPIQPRVSTDTCIVHREPSYLWPVSHIRTKLGGRRSRQNYNKAKKKNALITASCANRPPQGAAMSCAKWYFFILVCVRLILVDVRKDTMPHRGQLLNDP